MDEQKHASDVVVDNKKNEIGLENGREKDDMLIQKVDLVAVDDSFEMNKDKEKDDKESSRANCNDDDMISVKEKTQQTSNEFVSLDSKYDAYLLSLIKNLVGGEKVREWLIAGLGLREMEDVSISASSWQGPPFLIDPHARGLKLIRQMENNDKVVEIDANDG